MGTQRRLEGIWEREMKPVLLALWLLCQGVFALNLNELKSLERVSLQSAGQGNVSQLAFSPDGTRVATVVPGYFQPALVSLWDVTNGERLWQSPLTVDNDKVLSGMSFTPDNLLEVELRLDDSETNPDARYGVNFDLRIGKQVGPLRQLIQSLNWRLSKRLKLKLDPLRASDSTDHLIAYRHSTDDAEEIILLDAGSWQEIGRFQELHGSVTILRFSPDETQLAAARSDGRISLWDVKSRTKRYNLRVHQRQADQLEWSSDSKRLLSSNELSAIVWNAEAGIQLSRFNSSPGRDLVAASLEPAGANVALSFREGGVALMRTADGTITRHIGFAVAYSVFSSDAATLCLISNDSHLQVYRRGLNGYELRDEIRLEWPVTARPLLDSDRLILPLFYFGVGVYALDTKLTKQYKTPTVGDLNYIIVMLEPDRVWINSFLLDVKTGVTSQIRFSNSYFASPRPDLGKLLYYDRSALVLSNLTDGNPTTLWTRPWININPLINLTLPTWSSSGALLVAPWLEDKIIVLDAKTGKTKGLIAASYDGPADTKPNIEDLTVSPDDKLLIARYSFATWRYFNLETRKELIVPPALKNAFNAQFTPDGRSLMISTLEGLEFWGVPGKNVFGK